MKAGFGSVATAALQKQNQLLIFSFLFFLNTFQPSPELHQRPSLWKSEGISTSQAQRAQAYDSSDRGLMNDAHSCHFSAREAYFHALFLPIISYGIWITAIIIQLPFGAGLVAVNLWVALGGCAHLRVTSLSFGIMYCWVPAKRLNTQSIFTAIWRQLRHRCGMQMFWQCVLCARCETKLCLPHGV